MLDTLLVIYTHGLAFALGVVADGRARDEEVKAVPAWWTLVIVLGWPLSFPWALYRALTDGC